MSAAQSWAESAKEIVFTFKAPQSLGPPSNKYVFPPTTLPSFIRVEHVPEQPKLCWAGSHAAELKWPGASVLLHTNGAWSVEFKVTYQLHWRLVDASEAEVVARQVWTVAPRCAVVPVATASRRLSSLRRLSAPSLRGRSTPRSG